MKGRCDACDEETRLARCHDLELCSDCWPDAQRGNDDYRPVAVLVRKAQERRLLGLPYERHERRGHTYESQVVGVKLKKRPHVPDELELSLMLSWPYDPEDPRTRPYDEGHDDRMLSVAAELWLLASGILPRRRP